MTIFTEQLRQQAAALGINLNAEQAAALAAHWQLVKEVGAQINLTAIKDDEEALRKHYLDCLLAAEFVPAGARALDIGSGAGYPGVVLATACPDSQWLLLDSLQKRCRFLETVRQQLLLNNVEIICERAETAARQEQLRGAFDLVVARAVSSLPVLLEYALPFLRPGGLLVAMKGPALTEELAAASKALAALGGTVETVIERSLGDDTRCLALIRQTGACPDKYPRRAGMPEKRPL